MAEISPSRVLFSRLIFLLLAFLIVFLQLLPLNTAPGYWAAPDVLLACTLAWVSRRPDFLPVYVVVVVFFLTDLLFQRPPGLWTALVVILTEMLRARARGLRRMTLAVEIGAVALGIVAITIANRVILVFTMVPQASFGLTVVQMVMTIAVYPVVLFIGQYIFGLARPAPGQTNSLGRTI